MQLVTLAEAKERLSVDFDTKDGEITGLINAIEGYLYSATYTDFSMVLDSNLQSVAKEYVLYELYLDYYKVHTPIDDLRVAKLMNQLKANSLVV